MASEAHSVLEDRINEAVCVVADTERWCINVCSSKREQPKPLAASDLVKSMVEATYTLAKLKMSPELVSWVFYAYLFIVKFVYDGINFFSISLQVILHDTRINMISLQIFII